MFALRYSGELVFSPDGRPGTFSRYASIVTKFAIRPTDDSVWTLMDNGWLNVNNVQKWAGTSDFAFGNDGAVYWLGSGVLARLSQGSTTWQTIATNVGTFIVNTNGTVTTKEPAALDSEKTLNILGTPGNDNIKVTFADYQNFGLVSGPTSYVIIINGRTSKLSMRSQRFASSPVMAMTSSISNTVRSRSSRNGSTACWEATGQLARRRNGLTFGR